MPPRRTTSLGYQRARELRKELTPAERKLWAYIRGNQLNGVNFRRQHAIGKYIPDFCSPKAKLIIELDGSQHLEQEEYDLERTRYLESQGYKVLRFWNHQVMNDIDGVIRAILFALDEESPANGK
jgi:very-short-patch-repair endonuclease